MSNRNIEEPNNAVKCSNCHKKVEMAEDGWYDDPVEDGGACIGTIYTCPLCGYRDYC